MTTKMLINAQRAGQLRLAIVDGNRLEEYQVEIAESGLSRGNIYRGVVANVQRSLNAAFVDIGAERHGFLAVGDVLPSAYHRQPPEKERRPRIDQVLERGKPILVQVTKDGVGQKGPALNTNVALAGRYLVLTPFDGVRGVSRKAEDDDARKTIRDRLKKLNLPEGHGAIVRTNGLEQNQTMLNRDLNALLRLWKRVRDAANTGKGPRLIYSDQDLIVQALRDYLDSSIGQVIVDTDEAHEKAEAYMRAFMPRSKTKLVRYRDRVPLFSRYRLEQQIDNIYDRTAPLPSGGSIVIDNTEALTAIDVNSGRATKTANHDESIYKVNEEAAAEVARQLRLRDIGGLVVVDFIDMRLRKHQRKLEKVMRDAMKVDRARYSVGNVSANGLLEINRQRIKQALRLRTHRPCPTCHNVGMIPTAEFAAVHAFGRIEARATTGLFESVLIALHPEVADALQNEHRTALAALEDEFEMKVEVVSGSHLGLTEERIEWTQKPTTAEAAATPKEDSALSATDLADSSQRGRRKPASKAADDDSTEDESPKRKRPRRRRRSKSETAQETQSVDADAAETEAAQDDDSGDEKKSTRTRRRRSSRGSSSRRKSAAGDDEVAARGDDGDALEAQEAKDGDDDGAAKPKRKRRRRRRRKKPSGDAAPADAHGDDATAAAADAGESPADAADEEKAAKPRRRSRTTSRRRKKADSEADDADAVAKADDDGDAWNRSDIDPDGNADTDEIPRRTRRPSRRRTSTRRKTANEAPHSPSPAPSVPDNPAILPDTPPVGMAQGSKPVWMERKQSLRWQWWGGDGDAGKSEATGPDRDE